MGSRGGHQPPLGHPFLRVLEELARTSMRQVLKILDIQTKSQLNKAGFRR
jgi:hypothetical protein